MLAWWVVLTMISLYSGIDAIMNTDLICWLDAGAAPSLWRMLSSSSCSSEVLLFCVQQRCRRGQQGRRRRGQGRRGPPGPRAAEFPPKETEEAQETQEQEKEEEEPGGAEQFRVWNRPGEEQVRFQTERFLSGPSSRFSERLTSEFSVVVVTLNCSFLFPQETDIVVWKKRSR